MIPIRDAHGRSPIEAMIEMFIIITVAPVIVCCIVQAISMVVAIAIPWIAMIVIVIGAAACLVAALVAGGRNRLHLPPPPGPADGGGGDAEPVLPIRRPPALPAPGREQ